MIVKVFLLFLIPCYFTAVASPGVSELRELYYKAPLSCESAKKFLATMETINTKADPILICYQGAAQVIQAKYVLNPYSKYSYFRKGRQLIEYAVRECPTNIEIRFIRFCVQTNAPFFLGYNKNIDEDKIQILRAWGVISDFDLKTRIRNYMIYCSNCTKNEKAILL